MAFFGITLLGYQDPFRAARIKEIYRNGDTGGEGESDPAKFPALVSSSPYVSHGRYRETVTRQQALRTPKQTQQMPLTTNQHYGWWLPQDPKVKTESVHPWIQAPRHPMINSPLTRFVDKMAVTNKEFSLF
ncbi:testis-expressed protein 49 [Spea bombifrons]|uniref:testis-expressed protein 49 n=1 Tax=Spea bombifrons TaxID=233779 RepID=UPI00234B9D76|nr:testis-expressed protein 49 [Spea bombifrons]